MGGLLFDCQHPPCHHTFVSIIILLLLVTPKSSFVTSFSPFTNNNNDQRLIPRFETIKNVGTKRKAMTRSFSSANTATTTTTTTNQVSQSICRRNKQYQELSCKSRIRLNPNKSRSMPAPPPGAGIILSVALLIFLSVSDSILLSINDALPDSTGALEEIQTLSDMAGQAMDSFVTAIVPVDTVDVVTVVLAESIGGFVGAAITGFFNAIINQVIASVQDNEEEITTTTADNDSATINIDSGGDDYDDDDDGSSVVSEALVETDYFIARSAALPLLMAAGLPRPVASVTSALFAALRCQFIRAGYQFEEGKRQEGELMEQLLQQEQQKKQQSFVIQVKELFRRKETTVDLDSLVPATTESKIDGVEIFADVTRWLGYDVLLNAGGDIFEWGGMVLSEGASSALYGSAAALSAQLYGDVLYRFFQYGPKKKQLEVQSRSFADWATAYISTGISAAVLFGVYQASQRPVSQYLLKVLSSRGGTGNSCVDLEQPTGSSCQGQLLTTTLHDISQMIMALQDEHLDVVVNKATNHAWHQLQYVVVDGNTLARVNALADAVNSFVHQAVMV